MCGLWFLRTPCNPGSHLWRVQLWIIRWALRHLRWHRDIRCFLLQRVYNSGKRCKALCPRSFVIFVCLVCCSILSLLSSWTANLWLSVGSVISLFWFLLKLFLCCPCREMAVRRLWTWDQPRRTSSMNAKSMALKRDSAKAPPIQESHAHAQVGTCAAFLDITVALNSQESALELPASRRQRLMFAVGCCCAHVVQFCSLINEPKWMSLPSSTAEKDG